MIKYFLGIIALCLFTSTHALYSKNAGVVELTASNFDKLVLQDDSIWIVEFFAPWCRHCQLLVPEYEKAAQALKNVVKVGAIDADTHSSLSQKYGVKGFPTIKIFGQNKEKPVEFQGQRTAQGIADAGLDEIKRKVKSVLGGGSSSSGSSGDSSNVIELTDSNFDKLVLESDDVWLVEFYAPWCGHCKNLAPHWDKASTELKGKVKLGALDATVHRVKASQYDVKGFPTIKFFPGGKKEVGDATDYTGGRTASDIVAWSMDKYADAVPAPELYEITDEKTLDKACEGKPLCVVSMLPHILDCDSKCRNRYLDILREIGEKYKKKQWGWVWSEATAQLKLEESLEIGGFGYPAMAVVNFKKMKFSVLKGSFSKDGINEFLRSISYGRGETLPIKGATKPKIYNVQPWDGKDGELPVEEEIDLSDVVLDETAKTEL